VTEVYTLNYFYYLVSFSLEQKHNERNEVLLGLTPMAKNEEEAIFLLSDNFKMDESVRMMLIGAKLIGLFDTFTNLMIDKLKNNKQSTYTNGDDLLLLNSFNIAMSTTYITTGES
jgi:hypothetical protein